jgi:hypothetical protein
MPPGGIRFVEPRHPAMQWMDDHTLLRERVAEVIAWRVKNPNIYDPAKDPQAFDKNAVAVEIANFNCPFYPPEYCFDQNAGLARPYINPALCVCGATMTASYCKSCGSPQITGWKCGSCGRTK